MLSELTNLLPLENRKAFRREYFIRLGTVAVLVLTAVVVAQAIFLLPSYLYEREIVNARAIELQRLSANLATTQEQEAQAKLTALQTETTFLLGVNNNPTASVLLRAVLDVPRPGIQISGFVFGQPTDPASTNKKTLQLVGVAATRESLRSFDSALGALPFVSSADLPISAYAKDNQIPFTITLTGTLAP